MDSPASRLLHRHLYQHNSERQEPVFDEENPMGSTRHMPTWYTTKTCQSTAKSQISHCVADGTWEAHTANILETSDLVEAYAKNERLGFHIHYLWNGARRRYVPDFLIRLRNGKTLILEIKGQDSPQNKQKRQALNAWVEAVNQTGGLGVWCWDVAFEMGKVQDLLEKTA